MSKSQTAGSVTPEEVAPTPLPSILLTTKQAADLLNISPSWLEHARLRRAGPKHVKIGGKVLYRVNALHEWVERLEEEATPRPQRGRPRKHRVC